MIILAVDSGTEKIGFSIFEQNKENKNAPKLITSGLIKTLKTNSSEVRLLEQYTAIVKIVKKYKPDILVIEQIFFSKNQKTIISVAQSQGVILLLCAQYNIPLAYLTPLQIKQTVTGDGAADKKSVLKMLRLQIDPDLTVADDDESDAIACGLAYCYLNRNMIG